MSCSVDLYYTLANRFHVCNSHSWTCRYNESQFVPSESRRSAGSRAPPFRSTKREKKLLKEKSVCVSFLYVRRSSPRTFPRLTTAKPTPGKNALMNLVQARHQDIHLPCFGGRCRFHGANHFYPKEMTGRHSVSCEGQGQLRKEISSLAERYHLLLLFCFLEVHSLC